MDFEAGPTVCPRPLATAHVKATKAEGRIICSNTALTHRRSQLGCTLAGPGSAANSGSSFNHPHLAILLHRAQYSWCLPTGLSGKTSSEQSARHRNIFVHYGVLLFKCSSEARDGQFNGLVTGQCDLIIIKVWESGVSLQRSRQSFGKFRSNTGTVFPYGAQKLSGVEEEGASR